MRERWWGRPDAGASARFRRPVLVTIVPIVGAPRILAAAQNITDALGIVIAINAADAEAGAPASQR